MFSPQPVSPVFIVDDDPVLIALIAAWLAGIGRSSAPASSASEAALVVNTGYQFGALLMDLHLGRDDGSSVTRALLPHLPKGCRCILMSADSPAQEQLQIFDAFLKKPFNAQQLSTVLDGLPRLPIPPPPSTDAPLDIAVVDGLAAAMNPLALRELYAFTYHDARQRIEHLAAYLANGELDQARLVAHALRGCCAMTGMMQLASLAATVEQEGNPALFDRIQFLAALETAERMLGVHLSVKDGWNRAIPRRSTDNQ